MNLLSDVMMHFFFVNSAALKITDYMDTKMTTNSKFWRDIGEKNG
jgi:hypothetical protein